MKPVLVDTGILYALADRDDKWHAAARDFVNAHRARLIMPSPVLPEACYLINAYIGPEAEIAFLESVARRELDLESPSEADIVRAAAILRQYRTLNLGFVDAAVIAVAERLKIEDLLTTDRRHFAAVRPQHCPRLNLLP